MGCRDVGVGCCERIGVYGLGVWMWLYGWGCRDGGVGVG